MYDQLLQQAIDGDKKSLARCISIVENKSNGYEELLRSIPGTFHCPVIGITGAPGAGKSTITDGLIGSLVRNNHSVAVICIDPSSAFHHGALLGDRVRMGQWFTNEKVYIRSFASRGSLGGLNACILEIILLLQVCPFDFIIVETVGVGQSEVDIAALADITVVVLVPEGGDEVQTMKAGLMEIADIFVVNKSDRAGADLLVKHLMQMTAPGFSRNSTEIPVIKTIAVQQEGIENLKEKIIDLLKTADSSGKRQRLLASRAWHIIRENRMQGISIEHLQDEIAKAQASGSFSLYDFICRYNTP